MANDFNPRYVLYAEAHGEQPEEMLLRDEDAYPGGRMCGFVLWMNRRSEEAKPAHPEWFIDGRLYDHAGYDEWLKARVEELIKAEELG